MSAALNQFVLEAIDPETECIVSDIKFVTDNPDRIFQLLELDADTFNVSLSYPIEVEELAALTKELGLEFEIGSLPVWLRAHRSIDDLPYKVHTNRELVLMLEGSKPLASFSALQSENPNHLDLVEKIFDPYVATGRFVKRDRVYKGRKMEATRCNPIPVRRLLYALVGEEWRINAYFLLWELAEKVEWNEGFERYEGALLGYETWQTEIYINQIYRPAVLRKSKN